MFQAEYIFYILTGLIVLNGIFHFFHKKNTGIAGFISPPDVAYGLPPDSRISVRKQMNNLVVHLPAKGFNLMSIMMLFYVVFGFYVISIWTFGALMISAYIALVSLPFWYLILYKIPSLIWKQLFEKQNISFSEKQIQIIKKGLFFTKEKQINKDEIKGIKFGRGFTNSLAIEYQTPDKKKHRFNFFEFTDPDEKEWMINLLNDYYQLPELSKKM